MKFINDCRKWSFILAGFFFLAVCFSAIFLYTFSQSQLLLSREPGTATALYSGLAFILISGSLAIWLAVYSGKEALILHEKRAHTGDTFPSNEKNATALPVGCLQRQRPGEVSDDILERKRIELEIRHQNKKITESIHYAKRIQSAILPDLRLVRRALPDSFILYKPRDVVSGDFPWFAHVKNEILMAAVDCTGHGVPGALLSLVGYFLLNDIVRSRRITDPGKILDMLDQGVSTTLRPDEDSGTKDGMDISLCRINMENREVEYAGAHRPLYIMRNGVFEEIKGNKFPIGGGISKDQTSFNNYRIKLDPGDSIYYCSDGYCDQFGGPQGRKFGTRQLRQIIGKVHTLPMKEAHRVFEEQWMEWKGDQKQTDDVLLIGVKF